VDREHTAHIASRNQGRDKSPVRGRRQKNGFDVALKLKAVRGRNEGSGRHGSRENAIPISGRPAHASKGERQLSAGVIDEFFLASSLRWCISAIG
jgi:hypothetical protein